MAKMKNYNKDHNIDIPQHDIEALARCLLPAIQKFFDSEEGMREFEEWKQRQSTEKEEEK